jgi:peptidyl-prolyl cis-trans isomerase C
LKLNRMDAASGKTGIIRGRCAVVIGCILALSACGRQSGPQRPPEPGDQPVATVNGQTVWASDVKREAAAQGLIGQGDPLDVSTDTFHQALDELIDRKLLAAEALKRHLDNDPETKRRLAAARERILGDMLVETMAERTVSDSSIRALYNDEVKLSQQVDEFHARQIVAANQADAEAVKKALAAGGSFDTLAMQRSIDAATRFNGGDLGYFTADVMPQPYADALKTAKAGDLVGPFQTDAGWVLLKVEDRRLETPVSLEAARPQIVNFLSYEEVRDTLKALRRGSRIKLLIGPAVPSPDAEPEPASAPAAPLAASSAPPLPQNQPPVAVSSSPPIPARKGPAAAVSSAPPVAQHKTPVAAASSSPPLRRRPAPVAAASSAPPPQQTKTPVSAASSSPPLPQNITP